MWHLINILALTFGTHWVIYKGTKLGEEQGLSACLYGGIGHLFTQIVKIFVLATCLPSTSTDEQHSTHFYWLEEVLKSVISVIEVVGVQMILSSTPNLAKFSTHIRILAVGLGYSFAESAIKYFLPLVLNARTSEYTSTFLLMGLSANVSLVRHIAFVALVWLRTRTNFNQALVPVLYVAIAAALIAPSVEHYLVSVLDVSGWNLLYAHAAHAALLATVAYALLNTYVDSNKKSQ